MKALLFPFVTTLILVAPVAHSETSQAKSTCGTKHSPAKFVGEHGFVRGKIVSDGMHTTIVVPDECSNEGYALSSAERDDEPGAIIRQAIMRIGAPGTVDKSIL
jgi:predicted Abi (CAAX) family protease